MIKRIAAIQLLLCMLFCMATSHAEDWKVDEFGDEELTMKILRQIAKQNDFRTIAGYDTGTQYTYKQFTD